jgi:PAS domain S-box-containing protein
MQDRIAQRISRDGRDPSWPIPASEDRYSRLFDNVRDVIYTLDLEGAITTLNHSFERITGWSAGEWLGQPFGPLVHPEDLPVAMDNFRRVVQGETPSVFELRIVTQGGGYRVGEFLETPEIENGQVVGVLGIARDITERKPLDLALRESESNYRLFFEQHPHAMWVFDLETHGFLAVNDATLDQYGYSHDEFDRMRIEDLRLPEDRAALSVTQEWATQKLTPHELAMAGLWRLRKKDETVIHVDITWQRTTFKGRAAVLVLAMDVTSRQQASEALRESETRFRSVMDAASDAIVIASSGGNMVYVNKAAETIFGYTAGEMYDKPLSMLMPERYRAAHLIGLERVLATGQTTLVGKPIELEGLRKDGTEFPLDLSLTLWKAGDNTYCSGIIRDITERKQAEQSLREAYAQMEQRVEERTTALRDKLAELEILHDVVVGRELKMMALEKELEKLRGHKSL